MIIYVIRCHPTISDIHVIALILKSKFIGIVSTILKKRRFFHLTNRLIALLLLVVQSTLLC